MSEDPGFCAWLREKASDGHEIVLHGYFHKRPRRMGAWASTLVTECYTAGEGEFYDLSEDEAGRLLQNGLMDLKNAGFRPTGFIAPAWLLGKDAEKAVKKAGFAYTTRLKNIKNLTTGKETPSQSLVWSVRAAWRRQVSLWWNAALARRLADAPLVRVGLHPPDWEHPPIRMQALELIRTALAGRRVMTYENWIAREGLIR